ncbi:hypothetical protein [Streptomyces sp. JNUCC 63]
MSFLADAVDAIHEHAAEVYGLLDDAGRAELLEILADADEDPLAAADEVRDMVKTLLPADHPLRAALVPPGVRYLAPPPQDGIAIRGSLNRLLRRLESAGLVERDDRSAPGAPESQKAHTASRGAPLTPLVPHELQDAPLAPQDAPPDPPCRRPDAYDAWLLAEPSVPAASLGLTPEEPHDLILLTDEQEVDRVPAFQFDPETRAPYPVVVEINRMLSAGEDPWGAADWWLGSNVWLDAAPAGLLGTGADQALLSAARAEFPEW